MSSIRIQLAALAFLLLTPLINATPSITDDDPTDGMTTWFEDFTDRTNTQDFEGTLGVLGPFFQVGTGGSRYISLSADKFVFQLPPSGTATQDAHWNGNGYDVCSDTSFDQFSSIEFDVELTVAVGASEVVYLGAVTSVAASDAVGFFLQNDGSDLDVFWVANSDGGAQATGQLAEGVPNTPGQDLFFQLSGFECTGASFFALFNDGTTDYTQSADGGGAPWNAGELILFGAATPGTTHAGGQLLIGPITIISKTFQVQAAGSFCPVPGEDRFAFNYVEGVDFETGAQGNGIEISDFYQFQATADNQDYLAKGLEVAGTKDTFVHLTLEAASDLENSEFDVRFSFIDPTVAGYVSGNTFTTDAKGNGDDDESFAEYAGVRFQELDDDRWKIQVYKSNGGAVSTTGAAWTGGDSHTPTSFIVRLDTDPTEHMIVENAGGTPLLDVNVAGGHDTDPVWSLWYIGRSGDSGIFANDATTALDNNDDDFESACWFWNDLSDEDANVIGSEGGLPFDEENQPPPTASTAITESGESLGESIGIGDEGGRVLLAIVFMLIFGGFVKNEFHNSLPAFGIGAGIGLIFTIFIGLMPAVVTFLLVLGGAVFVGMRWFSGTGAAQADGGM